MLALKGILSLLLFPLPLAREIRETRFYFSPRIPVYPRCHSRLRSEPSECGGRISLAPPGAVAQLNHSRRQRVPAQPPQLLPVPLRGKNRIVGSGELGKDLEDPQRQGPGEEGSG